MSERHYATRNFWFKKKPIKIGDEMPEMDEDTLKYYVGRGCASTERPEAVTPVVTNKILAAADPAGNVPAKTEKELLFDRAVGLGFDGEYGKTTGAKLQEYIDENQGE